MDFELTQWLGERWKTDPRNITYEDLLEFINGNGYALVGVSKDYTHTRLFKSLRVFSYYYLSKHSSLKFRNGVITDTAYRITIFHSFYKAVLYSAIYIERQNENSINSRSSASADYSG
jgi:hypothetical protein